ncbi:MAG: Eco57I restriction-modification methylase domain-containing protein [Oscillospiraceae bacterium]|nr:Eco57I restriction-modification methylase domain-containing protein [Oscillospiraceae bacterium]
MGLLKLLLLDKTTKQNIIWATDAYQGLGAEYERDKEIKPELITGENSGVIKNRARKALEQQTERTRQHAEVFTPLWICNRMNDTADEGWFSADNPHPFGSEEEVCFLPSKKWQDYVDARRLEITCGEAPYLVSRYDVSSGENIPIGERIGLLDRKLRIVNENAADEEEWLKWTLRAFQSVYGYEFQGDNVLIARVNLLMTFEEHYRGRWKRRPADELYRKAANIIAWNIWQMDGLTGTIPYCKAPEEDMQMSMFDCPQEPEQGAQPYCRIFNWRANKSFEFLKTYEGSGRKMKFDFIIGNPPYQDETVGEQKAFAAPIYDKFLDNAYKIADHVEMIHPARFLFNAGGTQKSWNQKMLNDPHLKVLWYEAKSDNVFPNTDIKGGIAITYRNAQQNFGAIETFTAFAELNSVKQKVWNIAKESLSDIVSNRGQYRFADLAYKEQPEEMQKVTDPRISAPVFERMPKLFTEENPNDGHEYIQIYGNDGKNRAYRWFRKDYLKPIDALYKYKVMVPKANGSGAIGEVLSTPLIGQPLIGQPLIGHTETFISIGSVDVQEEADAILKYVKTKFARAMLGILKITQDNSKAVWRLVPLQNFTPPTPTLTGQNQYPR